MVMILFFFLGLFPLLVSARIGNPPSDACFRWNETDEDNLWWKVSDIEYPIHHVDPTLNKTKHFLDLSIIKSASQFFGGMNQDALMGGKYGSGGFIGTSMAVAGSSSCTITLGTTRVLIEQTPTRRTFAKIPVGEKKRKRGMPMAVPMMNIYGLTGGEADMRDYKYAAIRYVFEKADDGAYSDKFSNDIEFRAIGSDKFKPLNCGESLNNVSALKLNLYPSRFFPFEFDVSNLRATFGDSEISREKIKEVCGSKPSVGCPGTPVDRTLINNIPGVEDTILPHKLFTKTHSATVQINFKRLTETVYFMDFVLPVKNGYATPDNPRGRNRFFNIEWPFDRNGLQNQCSTAGFRPAIKGNAQCKIGNNTLQANTITKAKAQHPPIRSACIRTGYVTCYQDDQDPNQMTRMYFSICKDDRVCKKKYDSEPYMGYVSIKPHGAALARSSNRFEIYDKQDANCISTVQAVNTEPPKNNLAAAVVAVSTAVVVTTTVIAIIIIVSTTVVGIPAGALLAKYGLKFRTGLSELEVNLEKMCSDEMIEVKEAPDLSLLECVEFVIHTSYQPEDEDGKEQMARKMSSLRIKTQQSVHKVKETMMKRRKTFRASGIFRKKSSHVDRNATPLAENDVRILRDKADRSSKWSNDPAVRGKIESMTVDEAAAIMLYTQECCMYRRLNSALRAHDLVELQPYLPFMKLLLTALYKLPLVQAEVYRGVKLNLSETYNALAGKSFSWWSFSSTTLDLSVLKTPLFLGTEGERTLFRIQALGVDIAAFSAMPNESEVLMLPGMRLTVEPGTNPEEGLWEFDVSVSTDVAPIMDYPHPGCQDYDMVPDWKPSSLLTTDGRDGERRQPGGEEPVRRTAENIGSFWPTIPGAGI